MNCYVMDYNSCGIFKIIIPQEATTNEKLLREIFNEYSLKLSECSYMFTTEDLEVVTLKK